MFVFIEPFYVDTEHKEEPSSWSKDEIEMYKESQKKVIFDCSVEYDGKMLAQVCVDEKTYIDVYKGGKFETIDGVRLDTLHDLAEATNGELKLKNIEL